MNFIFQVKKNFNSFMAPSTNTTSSQNTPNIDVKSEPMTASPAEICGTGTMPNMSPSSSSGGMSNLVDPSSAVNVSLRCPITYKRISIPARGQECKHLQCFDLESYLRLHGDRGGMWKCPVCQYALF